MIKSDTKVRKRKAIVTESVKLPEGISATKLARVWRLIVDQGLVAVKNNADDPVSQEIANAIIQVSTKVNFPE